MENIFPGGSSFREASRASGAEKFDKRRQKDKGSEAGIEKDKADCSK